MSNHCIYHNRDLDGFCSGAIVRHYYNVMSEGPVNMWGWDYGMPVPPLTEYPKEDFPEIVYLVDIFPGLDHVKAWIEAGIQVVVLDHHKSTKEVFDKSQLALNELLEVHIDTTRAACEIVWEFLFPKEKLPSGVHLLGAYDSWRMKDERFKWGHHVLPFQWYARSVCNSLETFDVKWLHDDYILRYMDGMIETGMQILDYQDKMNELLMEISYTKKMFGHPAIVVNGHKTGSQSFKGMFDPDKHDIMISWFFDGRSRKYVVSLYSVRDDIDVSEIARKYDGGGHKGAAGFVVDPDNLDWFLDTFILGE